MKVKWKITTGYPGADHSGEWDVEDDTTDEEIDEMLQDELINHIDIWWERVEEGSNR
jgi:hypothetical protein